MEASTMPEGGILEEAGRLLGPLLLGALDDRGRCARAARMRPSVPQSREVAPEGLRAIGWAGGRPTYATAAAF